MKKIFLVTEYIHPNQNTTGYLFHKLYVHLKRVHGTDLSLIVKEDKNNESINMDSIVVSDVKLNKNKLIQRFLFELIISFRFFWKIVKNVKKDDLVFTGTTPIFLLPVVFIAKKLLGFKWLLLVHDVFPENLIAAQVLNQKNIFYRLLKLIFDKFYSAADTLIVIGQDMKELIDNKTKKNNSIVIQNWIDVKDIDVETKKNNAILTQLEWQDDLPIFQFFGNIGRVQGVAKVLEAIKLIEPSKRPKFIFMGDGAYAKQLESSLIALNDSNVRYIGAIHQSEKSKGLNAGDIAIVTLAEGMLGLGVPSKAYFSMAADKPILAIMDERSEIACMVKKYNIGWVVQPDDPIRLSEMILKITQNFKLSSLESSRRVLIEHFSEPIAMKKIDQVIEHTFQVESR